MFLPYNTDAPIYHWPFATVGLIAVNTAVFFGAAFSPDDAVSFEQWVMDFSLRYGTGLHPVQWLTASFVHLGVGHLVGNMFALWGFGLLVEGKLGWWKFLLVYLGMGIAQNMALQLVVPGCMAVGSAGASGVIFGLMAIALVWAPMNEMSCFIILFFRIICFEITVATFAALMAGLQLLFASLSGMAFGSETLHLVGAMFGLGVGIAMLRLGWVDCENWDFFSVWAGRHKMSREQLAELREKTPVDRELTERRRRSSLEQIQQILVDGRHELAYAAHRKMTGTIDDWRLPEPWFRKIIAGYHRAEQFTESIPVMVEYLRNYTEQAPLVRLKLAEILIHHARQPAQARHVLRKIPPEALDATREAYRRKLEQLADRIPPTEVLELQPQDW